MEKIGISDCHFEYITAIWYIFSPLVILRQFRMYFPTFWYIVSRKIWQP
jgi:hypothetical protein